MKKRVGNIRLCIALITLFLFSGNAWASGAPSRLVSDESHYLPAATLKVVENILVEHRDLTDETVFLEISRENQAPEDQLREWAQFSVKPANTALIFIWTEKKRLVGVAGYGFGSRALQRIFSEMEGKYFLPEVNHDPSDFGKTRGVVLAIRDLLVALESPLVESEKLDEMIQALPDFGSLEPFQKTESGPLSWVIFCIGALVFGLILVDYTLSREAHYTASGWVHVRRFPFQRWFRKRFRNQGLGDLKTGGGVSGSW